MKNCFFLALASFAAGQSLYSKCGRQAERVRQEKVKKCKTRAILAANNGARGSAKDWRRKTREKSNEINFRQMELCRKAETIYEPAGLLDEIPPSWGCPQRSVLIREVNEKLRNQSIVVDPTADFNIALVGMTGSGKSYFGNALLGELNPGRKIGVPFSSASTTKAVTQSVKAATGLLFGGRYDRELGLQKPIKINVFDTPGFADTDIQNVQKNKMLIASSLKYDIDMVIYLISNDRLDQHNQMALKMLNEWTTGQLWGNLVINKGRVLFNRKAVIDRLAKDEYELYSNTYHDMKSIDDVVALLQKFQDQAPAGYKWTKKVQVGDSVKSIPLTEGKDR